MKKFCAFLVLFAVTQVCFSSIGPSQDYTLKMDIINNSSQTLTYTGVSGENTGNVFLISPTQLSPGQKATLTGITTPYTDLSGGINFSDESGNGDVLTVFDPRQIKTSEGIFGINNEHLTSFDNKTLSQSTNPRSLLYTNVILTLQDNVPRIKKVQG